jgi:hypothetical protein
MKPLLGAAFLLATAPAFAQVPVLSNANLGTVKQQFTVTPAVWQGLLARQFVYVPPPTPGRDAEDSGPMVTVIPDSTPQPYIPPTYPLTNNSYAPSSPSPYPFLYPVFSDGFGAGKLSQGVVIRGASEDHDAPRLGQVRPPSPPPAPAKEDRPAHQARGSLPLGRLSVR